jgi:dinuclear metal center YbgI/SA1388 family protein
MKVKEITKYLESLAPLSLQASYDNAGLIVGNEEQEITGILICLDSVEDVLEEAIQKSCNLVIAHHPIVFRGLKKLNGKNYVERTLIKAIKNDIAIYAAHTNLDSIYAGVNAKICEKIGLINRKILAPNKPDVQTGAGMIAELPQNMVAQEFLAYLKQKMNLNVIRHTNLLDKEIRKVALCGGAGSFLLPQAIAQQADIFITGDFKYHEFFDADKQIIIADIGHYESEIFTNELFLEMLAPQFPTIQIYTSQVNTNPIAYFVS